MGRKMYAYLGYLYCLAEGWSKSGSVLSQIQVSWNMGYLEGMKWMEWMASHLNLFGLHNLQLEIESGLLSFFLKKITPLSFADISWILWSFEWDAFVEWTCGIWDGDCRGDIAGKSGCQYQEWMTDRPAMFGLANGGFCGIKTCRWQVPFLKWIHHSTKLKVTSDS